MENLAYLEDVEQDSFVIDNDGLADWAIERIKEHEEASTRYIQAAKMRIDMLNQQIAEEGQRLENRTGGLKHALADYFEKLPKKATKTQEKVVFPSGELVRKFPKIDFERDNEKLIKLLEGTSYVESKPNLKWADLKKDLEIVGDAVINKQTGEVVEGIAVIEKPATFEVK